MTAAKQHTSSAALGARWGLIAPHQGRLVRLGVRRGCTREEAEDLASEALLRAATFDALDESRVAPFLNTVMMRLVVDQARHQQRQRRLHPRLADPPSFPSHEDVVCDRIEGLEAQDRLDELTSVERQVLELRARGVAINTIARQMHLSTKTVEGAYTRARRRMRRWLAVTGAGAGLTSWRRWFAVTASVAAVPVLFLPPGQVPAPPSIPPEPAVASGTARAHVVAPSLSLLPGPDRRAQRGVARMPVVAVLQPAVKPAAARDAPPRSAPLAVRAPHMTRHDEDETLVESVERCLRDGPVITVNELGCPPADGG